MSPVQMKMMLELGTTLCLLLSFIQMSFQKEVVVLDMMPDTFDDQYIGCADKMEAVMPKILEVEMRDDQFATMWNKSSQEWNRTNFNVPKEFKDEYGIALLLYTMESPYPIYSQLNRNISIAGQSRDYYMDKFHFKALHFYLTRALQMLRSNCSTMTQVYRGTNIGPVKVTNEMRFDRFASSSLSKAKAQKFGQNPFFIISTCYGVDIDGYSPYEELEFLIPVGETFNRVSQSGTTYTLKSTRQICSFFNCTYFGCEKQSSPTCTPEKSSAPGGFSVNRLLFTGMTITVFFIFLF
ncbi:ecto-ADP-ribosyltransferase 5-like [Hyperolius riggenbachi]|uniref:ecto-ADP-ribosyltransferase 5-like n=1 Tax=Hyperolius riggenbachi TaxID=752182 RepID=UPI0035A3D192